MDSRRQFILAAGTTATVTLAGCSSILGPDNSPEDAVVSFYQAFNEGDQEGVEAALHSQSPTDAEDVTQDGSGEFEVTVESTSVATEGPSESEIRDAIGDGYGEEDIQQIVDAATSADNSAIVEAEVTFSFGGQSETSTEQIVVAAEDGSYKVLG